uniref:TTF-type domain-containing protein n=1 Tax=Lactuca sativa TaxID=4236 RepID=A0A9R1UXP2_LACSA|nr:hypothetical protein LSAT_V11C700366410 [Lactuca sativa]
MRLDDYILNLDHAKFKYQSILQVLVVQMVLCVVFNKLGLKKIWWLEYYEKKDAAFCFPCFLFNKKPIGRVGSDTFTVTGFNKWKKVNWGKDCAFIVHDGKTPTSTHNFSIRCYEDLKNQLCHIENVIEKQTTQQVMDNRLCLKGPDSRNQGNFLELIKLLIIMLENAPQNAKYTSPNIQKEILCVLATNVQKAIRDEIGIAKFCLIVDESQDESKKEKMAIVVRFIDRGGHVKERFLDLIHVKDTTSSNLKNEIMCSLSYHNLSVLDIRGQGYDGAINVISSSSKRNDQLQDAQIAEITHLIEVDEIESGKGKNQIRTLQRPGDTRWSSHFKSICSLMRLFGPSCVVLTDIATKGSTSSKKCDAIFALKHAMSFDFVIVLHMMKDIMGIRTSFDNLYNKNL